MLYVITDGNHFKFGASTQVYGRVRALQTGNPRKLSIVATIPDEWTKRAWLSDRQCEAAFHGLLDHGEYRIVGEWFKDTPAVRAVIDLIKAEQWDWLCMMTNYFWRQQNNVL